MELRRYLAIVKAHWLLAGATFAATVLVTLYLVMPQPWIYESTGSLRVQPSERIKTSEDVIRAWANLSEPKVTTTYATLIQSDLIVGQAETSLPDTADTEGISVDAQVLIDTTIITITTTGQDSETVRDMTSAVMDSAVTYADGVDTTYQLVRVEEPDIPSGPVGPNKNLQLILGVLFGAMLALALALFAEYIRRPVEDFAITDPATGASNELYLRHRLREETARTVRTSEPFTVATLRVEVRTGENDDMAHVPADRDLRRIARGLRLTVPDEAVLAYLGGGLFAALLPAMRREQIDATVGGWAAAVGALLDWVSQGELGRRLQLTTGVCEFRGTATDGSAEVEKLVSRLIGETRADGGSAETAATATTDGAGDAPAKGDTPATRPGNGQAPTAEERATDVAASAPRAQGSAAPRPPAERTPTLPSAADGSAMPPAPVQTTTRPGNGGSRSKAATGTPRKVRRVTVIPEIDDMPPRGSAATDEPGAGATETKSARQGKGDVDDPTG